MKNLSNKLSESRGKRMPLPFVPHVIATTLYFLHEHDSSANEMLEDMVFTALGVGERYGLLSGYSVDPDRLRFAISQAKAVYNSGKYVVMTVRTPSLDITKQMTPKVKHCILLTADGVDKNLEFGVLHDHLVLF